VVAHADGSDGGGPVTELRPPLRDVVSIEIAEAELHAVRDLLAQLEEEVDAEQRAADAAERRARPLGSSLDVDLDAVERSRRIVEEMAATRQASWRSSYEEARLAAEARLAEATRLADELLEAAHREVSEIVASGWPAPASTPTAAPPPAADPHHPPAPPVDLPAPALIAQAADSNEAFWREAAAASAARSAATKALESFAPIEAILPTIALVIVLIAVLLLVG
jgi:hypothetical protein